VAAALSWRASGRMSWDGGLSFLGVVVVHDRHFGPYAGPVSRSEEPVPSLGAIIRKQRPPEPYKGKGIRYEGEHVQRKVGKRA